MDSHSRARRVRALLDGQGGFLVDTAHEPREKLLNLLHCHCRPPVREARDFVEGLRRKNDAVKDVRSGRDVT
jgi:hypothetical protein